MMDVLLDPKLSHTICHQISRNQGHLELLVWVVVQLFQNFNMRVIRRRIGQIFQMQRSEILTEIPWKEA